MPKAKAETEVKSKTISKSKTKSASTGKMISVKLIKSLCKRTDRQLGTARGLGLRRMHQTVEVLDTPANRGMINHISFLLEVEEPV